MSSKRNTHNGGKKARLYGSAKGGGMRKHRTSGASQVNPYQRRILCEERNREDAREQELKRRRTEMFESVSDLMKER